MQNVSFSVFFKNFESDQMFKDIEKIRENKRIITEIHVWITLQQKLTYLMQQLHFFPFHMFFWFFKNHFGRRRAFNFCNHMQTTGHNIHICCNIICNMKKQNTNPHKEIPRYLNIYTFSWNRNIIIFHGNT